MKFIFFLLLAGAGLLLPFFSANSQAIALGEQMPDSSFSRLFNSRDSALQLSRIGKKLIILDFWDFSCASCIQAFPKIDQLQKQFDKDVQFILVNKQSPAQTREFLAKRKRLKIPDVPFICGDSLLKTWFPHQGKPFHVWLDSERRALFFLDGFNTTSERIDSFLTGYQIQPRLKTKDRNYITSLAGPALQKNALYQSLLTRCIEGFTLRSPYSNNEFAQLSANCWSLREILTMAFNEGGLYHYDRPGRMILSVEDSILHDRPKDNNLFDQWRYNHSYNYMLFLPERLKEQRYLFMQADICRYFGLKALKEKRKVPGLLLEADSAFSRLYSKGGTPVRSFYQSGIVSTRHDSLRIIRNMPYSYLYGQLEYYLEQNFMLPVADGIRVSDPIDISLPGKLLDEPNLENLRSALKEWGIRITPTILEIEVLVIKKE